LTGLVIGSAVNMGIIMMSDQFIPLPDGVIAGDMESLKSSIHLFKPIHFLFPFLAHALGTLVGAFLAALIAENHKMKFALGVGLFFLIGGIANIFIIGGPIWFMALDLLGAYLPMAWLGSKLVYIRKGG